MSGISTVEQFSIEEKESVFGGLVGSWMGFMQVEIGHITIKFV